MNFRITQKGESPFQGLKKENFIKKPKGSLSIFDDPVIIQSGPVNKSSFVEVTNQSVGSRNEMLMGSSSQIINDSLENLPKKGKTAVASSRKGQKLNMGILNQINSEKGKSYVATSASLNKMKIDSKEKSLVELYS